MKGMPKIFENLGRLVKRFQYPNSWVKDVAEDLGFSISHGAPFEALIEHINTPHFRPGSLYLSMPRKLAEGAFQRALKKEVYQSCSLFSYYFDGGWLVMALHFDQAQRLSKVYVSCPAECSCRGFSILLDD
jgi:hypothetical protein